MRIEQIAIPLVRQLSRSRLGLLALSQVDEFAGLFDPEALRDPHAPFVEIRKLGEVQYNPKFRQWYLFGYDHAKTLLSSPDCVTSEQNEVLLTVYPYNKLNDRTKSFLSNWLLFVDPPDHSRLRALVSRAFTPRQVARLEARMDTLVQDLLSQVEDQSTVEICEALTNVLPVNVICELLGFPPERWGWAREITESMIALLDIFGEMDPKRVDNTVAELNGYLLALCDERRRNPADDLITGLVQAEIDGDRLSDDDLLAMVGFILGAGHETTANALALAIINLARNPDQAAFIRANPDRWPQAVDEMLRFDTPVQVAARTTTAPMQFGDTTIPAGSNVLAFLSQANRDPAVFDDPASFRLDRTDAAPLLSFGHGIHYCLGASLAKLEMRAALPAFLDAFGDFTVDEDSVEYQSSAVLRRVATVNVTRG